MKKLIRLIAVVAVLICLPLEGMAAATMPFCVGEAKHSVMAQAEPQEMSAMMPCHDMAKASHDSEQHAPQKSSCNNSAAPCSLCAAQALISFEMPAVAAPAASVPIPVAVIGKIPLLSSSLFRPPIPASA